MAIAPPYSSSREPTDEQLLVAALRGDQRAWTKLSNSLDRYLLTVIRRRAADLPDDLWREVIQEVWAEAATHPDGDFDPLVTPARHYIAGFIGLGLDHVRAAYRAPGERSRRRDAVRGGARLPGPCRELVSLDELSENDQPEDPRCQVERDKVEATIDIGRALALASPMVARAIDVMWHEDLGFGTAAAMVGINRLTLRRQLLQLGLRLAAA